MIVYTSYRNYPFPDYTEDLKTSNTVLNDAFNKIDVDINDLYTIKAEIDDTNTITDKTWSSSKISDEINSIVSSSVDADTILSELKTVDGSGSGLDADLLDGVDSSAFALADLSNVDDSGILTKIKNVDGSGSGLDADTIDGLDSTAFVLVTDYEDSDVLTKIKNVDGSGSGLDADLLDGLDSTQFTRKDIADTRTGDLSFSADTDGIVLIDRSDTTKKYRLYVDSGALNIEEVV